MKAAIVGRGIDEFPTLFRRQLDSVLFVRFDNEEEREVATAVALLPDRSFAPGSNNFINLSRSITDWPRWSKLKLFAVFAKSDHRMVLS